MRAALIVALALAACVERRTFEVADGGAIDAPELVSLTVLRAGRGTGTVTSMPDGIACGADCQHGYAAGSRVTLTAAAAPGSVVAGWSVPLCSRLTCAVDILDPVEVTVAFDLEPTYELIVSRDGPGAAGGTVRSIPSGIDCGAVCAAEFTQGSQVELTPSVVPGTVFTAWTGACAGSGPCIVTMDAAQEVKAGFGIGPREDVRVPAPRPRDAD